MQTLSFDRSTIAATVTVTLATLGALALFALVAAHWSWEWLAPPSQPRTQVVEVSGLKSGSADDLFGHLERARNSAASTGIALKLLGLVAATAGRDGYALIQVDSKEVRTVREGAEIAPGIRLAEVGTNHVILERSGMRETLAWPEKNSSAALIGP
ncbi:MAG TPA: type II secretion system protein N [Gallionella sp.]|nr:type II secretion system protein N [Gallionella sp.]